MPRAGSTAVVAPKGVGEGVDGSVEIIDCAVLAKVTAHDGLGNWL